ncbi:hypothetical protein AAMO2058_000249100 [Amorphochlora amoebiformis]
MSVYRPHGRKRRKLSEAEGSHRRVRARREERPWWGLHREVLSPWLRARSIVDIILGYVLVPGLEGKLLKTEIPSFLSDPDDMRARNLPIWMCKGHPSISDLTALPRGLFYILSSQSTEERVHAFEGFGRGAKHSEPWKGSKDRSFGCLHSRAIVAVSSIASKVHFASAAREGKGKGKVNKNSFEIGTCHIDERTHRLGKYQKHFQTKLGVDALAVSQDGQRMFLVRCRERSVCITRNHDILQGVGDEFDLVELMGDTSSTSEGISIVAVRRAICISANESVLILLECKSAARTDNFCVLLLYRDKLCRVVRISRGTARKFQPCVTDLCVCEESGEVDFQILYSVFPPSRSLARKFLSLEEEEPSLSLEELSLSKNFL